MAALYEVNNKILYEIRNINKRAQRALERSPETEGF